MEQHFLQVTTESKVAHTFTNFHMHEFIEHNKRKTAEGNCLILEWNKQESTGPNLYLKMNNFEFCKRINESVFIKVRYLRSTSFLFFNQFNDNLVYAVSVHNESTDLHTFEDLLGKNGTLTDYQSPDLKYQVKVRIDFHIDHVLENEVIINFNKSAKIGKALGSFFGKINDKLAKKTAETEAKIQDQLKRVTRQSFSDSTRSKWETIVEKAVNLNEKMTVFIKPLNQGITNVVNQLGQKYHNSENQYVKAMRDFTKEAQDSINEGYYCPPLEEKMSSEKNPAEDQSVNGMMGQHLILNEELPEKTPYPEI